MEPLHEHQRNSCEGHCSLVRGTFYLFKPLQHTEFFSAETDSNATSLRPSSAFREIVDEGEKFTWDSLIDKEEEDVVSGVSQDEPTVVD